MKRIFYALVLCALLAPLFSVDASRSAHFGYQKRDSFVDTWNDNSKITREEFASVQDVYAYTEFVKNTYEAILQIHGARQPFSAFVGIKKQEMKMLDALLDKYAIPQNTEKNYQFPVPDLSSWKKALQSGVLLEQETKNYVGGRRMPVITDNILNVFDVILRNTEKNLTKIQKIAQSPNKVYVSKKTIDGRGTQPDVWLSSKVYAYTLQKRAQEEAQMLAQHHEPAWLASAPEESDEDAFVREATDEELAEDTSDIPMDQKIVTPIVELPEFERLETEEERAEKIFRPQDLEVTPAEQKAVQEVADFNQFLIATYQNVIDKYGARAPFHEMMTRLKQEENRLGFLFRRYTIMPVTESKYSLPYEDIATWEKALDTAKELTTISKTMMPSKRSQVSQKYIENTFDFIIKNIETNLEAIDGVLVSPDRFYFTEEKLPGRGVEPDAFTHSQRYKYKITKENQIEKQRRNYWLNSAEKDTRKVMTIEDVFTFSDMSQSKGAGKTRWARPRY